MKSALIVTMVALTLLTGTGQITAQTIAPVQSRQDPAQQAKLAQWKGAIEDVFRTRLAFRKKLLKHRINKQVYARDIAKIDTTACPKSFRIAWMHYVIAWQKLSTDPSGIVPLVEIVVAAHTGHIITAAHEVGVLSKDESKKKQDSAAITTAMLECQEVAIEYNASLSPD
jgi:hypothetical protein